MEPEAPREVTGKLYVQDKSLDSSGWPIHRSCTGSGSDSKPIWVWTKLSYVESFNKIMNDTLGRRKTIMATCMITVVASIAQIIPTSWQALAGVRLIVGR